MSGIGCSHDADGLVGVVLVVHVTLTASESVVYVVHMTLTASEPVVLVVHVMLPASE